jgi:hypothetical protein
MQRFILLSLLLFSQFTKSQTLNGTLADSITRKPIELATVILLRGDSVVYSTESTAKGGFTITATTGEYDLAISAIGYEQKKIKLVEIKQGNASVGQILLQPKTFFLKETEIVATKQAITMTAGKIVFDVEKSTSAEGGNLKDLLQEIPGVTVDNDNKITVKGKSGVKILVNGRTSAMANNDLEAFLKSLPSNSIQSIEVITNPSSKYEAEGAAVIIDVKLKKGVIKGFNGSVSAGMGTAFTKPIFGRRNASGNANFKNEHVNVFSARNYESSANFSANDTVTFNGNSIHNNKQAGHTFNAGTDWYINKKNTIGFAAEGSFSKSNWISNATSERTRTGNYKATYLTKSSTANTNNNISTNVYYEHKYDDTSSRKMNVELTYSLQSSPSTNNYLIEAFGSNDDFIADESISEKRVSKKKIHNVIAALDYIAPLKISGHSIETGIRNELNITTNPYTVYNTSTSIEVYDSAVSNFLKYTDNVAAAYVTYNAEFGDFDVSGGLRAEQTNVLSNRPGVYQNYVNLFPDLSATYHVNDSNTLGLNYSNSIYRPSFWEIDNQIKRNGKFSLYQGNPALRPQTVHDVSLEYNSSFRKQNINIGASFTYTRNVSTYFNQVLAENVILQTYKNVGNSVGGTVSLSAQFTLTKWWSMNLYGGYYFQQYRINSGTLKGVSNIHSGSFNFSTNFTFWGKTTLSISMWGGGGWGEFQTRYQPIVSSTISIKKNFLKDKLTVRLSCNEPLNTMQWRSKAKGNGFYSQSKYVNQNPTVNVGLSYRFGKEQFNMQRNRERSSRGSGKSNGPGGM